MLAQFHFLVGTGMHWLGYIIGIEGKVERNTFDVSVMVSYLAYFGTATRNYGIFRKISSVTALATNAVTAK
jgi:hypothetical protein